MNDALESVPSFHAFSLRHIMTYIQSTILFTDRKMVYERGQTLQNGSRSAIGAGVVLGVRFLDLET